MHAQVWADCADLIANEAQLRKLGLPVVLDHMAQINIAAGPKGSEFLRLCELLRDGQVFVKLTICRNSKQRPDYDELRPFHDALVNANPDGLVWGSDWPHLRMNDEAPDSRGLLALFLSWISDVHIVRKILVDTPETLFGFTPAEK